MKTLERRVEHLERAAPELDWKAEMLQQLADDLKLPKLSPEQRRQGKFVSACDLVLAQYSIESIHRIRDAISGKVEDCEAA